MEALKIEADIPIPDGKTRDGNTDMGLLRSAFRVMAVGNSFFWPKTCTHPYLAAKQVGVKITCRKQDKGGWRIWLRSRPRRQGEYGSKAVRRLVDSKI